MEWSVHGRDSESRRADIDTTSRTDPSIVAGGRNGIAPSIIVVVRKATARFLGASIDDTLAGRFTPPSIRPTASSQCQVSVSQREPADTCKHRDKQASKQPAEQLQRAMLYMLG
jgi:hypothetical protein